MALKTRNAPQIQHPRFESIGIALHGFLQGLVGGGGSSTVIRWELIGFDQFQQSFLVCSLVGDDFNFVGGAWIEPSTDESPRGRKERRCIDNEHLVHGLGEANGINRRLLFDNGQGTTGQLRGGQPAQIQNAETFEPVSMQQAELVWGDVRC